MLTSTGFKRILNGFIHILFTCIKVSICQYNIKISWPLIKVMMPDLNSKHKITLGVAFNNIRDGVWSISVLTVSIDDNFIKSINNLRIKCDDKSNDDGDRHNTSEQGSILRFLFVPQQFSCVEEISFINKTFNPT